MFDRKFTKEFEVKLKLHVEVTHYVPERPAPACSNPDSPSFSDSGDDVELEFILTFIDEDGVQTSMPEELDYLYEHLFDDILDHYESSLDNNYPFS